MPEFKNTGGRTLRVDGIPVDQTADQVEWKRPPGYGGDSEPQSPPSAAHDRAAVFAVEVAAKLLRRETPPKVVWEMMPRERRGYTKSYDRKHVFLSTDLALAEVIEVALHETCHVDQLLAESGPAKEAQARGFGERWRAAVFSAGWATDWDVSRISLSKRHSPPRGVPTAELPPLGTVVLYEGSGEAWLRERRPGRSSWRPA